MKKIIILIILLLSGCSSKSLLIPSDASLKQNIEIRQQQLNQLKQWKIIGKIAFIQQKKRESASLTWQVDIEKQTQKLNLNSYLGINVLQLESNGNLHKIKVDGKEHVGKNLEALVFSLTGLTLPTKALNFWLKGLPYLPTDTMTYNTKTFLPETLSSDYGYSKWEVQYDKYQIINNYRLASSFTLKKDNLLIKIAIKQWQLSSPSSFQ